MLTKHLYSGAGQGIQSEKTDFLMKREQNVGEDHMVVLSNAQANSRNLS